MGKRHSLKGSAHFKDIVGLTWASPPQTLTIKPSAISCDLLAIFRDREQKPLPHWVLAMEHVVNTRFNRGLQLAEENGIEIRYEYLHGQGGGICHVNQHPQLFVDLALSPLEQLQILENAMQLVIDEQWPIPHLDQLIVWVESGTG